MLKLELNLLGMLVISDHQSQLLPDISMLGKLNTRASSSREYLLRKYSEEDKQIANILETDRALSALGNWW